MGVFSAVGIVGDSGSGGCGKGPSTPFHWDLEGGQPWPASSWCSLQSPAQGNHSLSPQTWAREEVSALPGQQNLFGERLPFPDVLRISELELAHPTQTHPSSPAEQSLHSVPQVSTDCGQDTLADLEIGRIQPLTLGKPHSNTQTRQVHLQRTIASGRRRETWRRKHF
jgi:hypothetical protein